MRAQLLPYAVPLAALLVLGPAGRGAGAETPPEVRITLEDALRLALQHNHALRAARTTIKQSEAQETTANLRPNPTLQADGQFLPLFDTSLFTSDYLKNNAQFDAGLSYLFELGGKRGRRLKAARDATAQTRSLVQDNERTLTFQVASQFISVELAESTLDLAQQDMKSFEDTVNISEARYKAGDIGEGDFLKIKLQLLQFQTDLSQAELAKVEALTGLRQLLGYESVPSNFDVTGEFEYAPVVMKVEELQERASAERPDLKAALQGVQAASSQLDLAKANRVRDFTGAANYTHTAGMSSASLFGSIELPFFDRNQGEIARTTYVVTQAQEQATAAAEQVKSDVIDAYEGVRTNDQVMTLYLSGYRKQAKDSLDISEYAYKRGAASLLDFLDAARSYRAIELAYRQALAGYLTAVEQLKEAVGTRSLQ